MTDKIFDRNKIYKVRAIRKDELEKLLELYKHLNPDDPDIYGVAGTDELWDEISCDPGQKILVIDEDGILVASCTLVIVKNLTRGAKPYALIENVVTHENYRRKGYGQAVLQKAIEIAKTCGCYKIMLLTGRKDEGVLSFYGKAGFECGIKTAFCIKFHQDY